MVCIAQTSKSVISLSSGCFSLNSLIDCWVSGEFISNLIFAVFLDFDASFSGDGNRSLGERRSESCGLVIVTAVARLLILERSCSFSLDLRLIRRRETTTGDPTKYIGSQLFRLKAWIPDLSLEEESIGFKNISTASWRIVLPGETACCFW